MFPKKIKIRRGPSVVSSRKKLNRVLGLSYLLRSVIPDEKPVWMEEHLWNDILVRKSDNTLVKYVSLQDNRLIIDIPTSYDAIIHSACSIRCDDHKSVYHQSVPRPVSQGTRFRWWSDTLLDHVSPITNIAIMGGAIVRRTIGVPALLSSHPFVHLLLADKTRRDEVPNVFGEFFECVVHSYFRNTQLTYNPSVERSMIEEIDRFVEIWDTEMTVDDIEVDLSIFENVDMADILGLAW